MKAFIINQFSFNFKDINIRTLLIFFLPISFILGNAAVNLNLILIVMIFLYSLVIEKNIKFLLDKKNIFIFSFFILIAIKDNIFLDEINWKSIFLLKYYLFYLSIIYFILKNPKLIINFSKFLLIILVLFCLDIAFQFNFGENILGISSGSVHRFSGFMGDEWVAGSYISKFALLTLLFFFNLKNNKSIILFLLIFYFPIILFTGERMALFNYIFTIFLFIYFFHKQFLNFKKIIFILVIIPTIFIIFFSTLNEDRQKIYTIDLLLKLKLADKSKNFVNFSDPDKSTIDNETIKKNTHLDIFISSIKMIKYNYILGTGTNKFFDVCNKYNKNKTIIHCENHPHNLYLSILSEQGIFIFMIFLIIIFKDIFLNFKTNTNRNIHLIPFLILLTLINPISVSGDFFSTWTGTFFWFIFAIYSGLTQLTKKIK